MTLRPARKRASFPWRLKIIPELSLGLRDPSVYNHKGFGVYYWDSSGYCLTVESSLKPRSYKNNIPDYYILIRNLGIGW